MKKIVITLCSLLVCVAVMAQEATAPIFTTDIAATDSNEIVMTQKGRCAVDVYSAYGTELIKRIAMPQTPTGVVVSGDTAYVTTFKSEGTVEIVSLSRGEMLYQSP
ncbi:MAG: hypothetical protein SNG10_07365, partial [Rikenellaceae bacterium]